MVRGERVLLERAPVEGCGARLKRASRARVRDGIAARRGEGEWPAHDQAAGPQGGLRKKKGGGQKPRHAGADKALRSLASHRRCSWGLKRKRGPAKGEIQRGRPPNQGLREQQGAQKPAESQDGGQVS